MDDIKRGVIRAKQEYCAAKPFRKDTRLINCSTFGCMYIKFLKRISTSRGGGGGKRTRKGM